MKGKGKAKNGNLEVVIKQVSKREVKKPALHKEWLDIPDWKERKDSPLMELPVDVLDRILCVRPELGVSSLDSSFLSCSYDGS
jgi:hypothetical protein